MSRTAASKGASPSPRSGEATRQHLLEVAKAAIARHGFSKVSLSDVAEAAGVTRPTVYRYFGSAAELFNAAAVTASGGALERMRSRTLRLEDPVARVVEGLVAVITEIPGDPYLEALFRMRDTVSVDAEREHAFVSRELSLYLGEAWAGDDAALAEIAELLLRLLRSFVDDPGPERDAAELRNILTRWLAPILRPLLQ